MEAPKHTRNHVKMQNTTTWRKPGSHPEHCTTSTFPCQNRLVQKLNSFMSGKQLFCLDLTI